MGVCFAFRAGLEDQQKGARTWLGWKPSFATARARKTTLQAAYWVPILKPFPSNPDP